MPKFVTIQNLEQYNSKINPRIQDLEQVSDLGYLVNYIKQTQTITYTVELDGKTYTCKANVDPSENLPKLSDIEDYYGFSQIKEYVETLKNTDYLTLSGGNLTGSLTINNQKVATEDFVSTSINNLNSTYLGISAKAESAKSADSVSWDNVSDKSTTLSGYGITDAYTKAQVDKKVSDLVNSAPETLDTLNELANALGNDPNFATTIATQIGTKANDSDVVHKSGDETVNGVKTFTSRIVGSIDKAESAKSADSVAWDNVSGKPSSFNPSSHTHDDRYYTESEIDTKLSSKSDTTHNHDSVYLGIDDNAFSSSKLQNARVLTIEDGLGNSGAGASFDGSKNVTISLPPYIATQLLKDRTKNDGNDYYDDSDITSLIYAGNGEGTLRNEIANGNFSRIHPGDYIIGKSTGTKWIVAHNDYWYNRGDSPLTRHHLCLIPEILAGNSGNLLWSGKTYAGSSSNNSSQGYAPWASDNWSEGKNNTSGAYYNSFIKQSILPKVYTYWLKKDFEDQGISLLTFRNLLSDATNTNAPVKGYSAWAGACSSWAWYDSKCDLLSEANVYGNNHWQSSGYDCGAQKEQLALFKFRHTLEVWGRQAVWLQDVASSSLACFCDTYGDAGHYSASYAFMVAPFCLIA